MSEAIPSGGWRLSAAGALCAGAAAYVLAPWPALAGGGALAYVAAAALNPQLALRLAVASLPFYLLTKSLPSLPFSPTEFLLLGCFAGWLAQGAWALRAGGQRPPPRLPRPDWPLLLFVAGALGATVAAENLGTHVRQLRLLLLDPLILYWLAGRYARGAAGFFGLLEALALGGAAAGLYAIYQYLFTTETIVAEGIARARGLYGSPNNLGLFLGRVVPLCACLALWGGRRRLRFAVLLLPAALALGLTFSVGAWLGVAAALLFAAVVGGQRRLALLVAAGFALAIGLSWALGLERITSHFSLDTGTGRWRAFVWQAGWQMARDHPLLGIGLDNFLGLYQRYMAPEAWPEPNLSHPHNLLLDFWLSTGLAGLVGGLWLLGRLWWRGLALWRLAPAAELRAAGLGLAAGAVDFAVHGAIDNSYFLPDLALVFWLSQALVSAQQLSRQSAIIEASSANT